MFKNKFCSPFGVGLTVGLSVGVAMMIGAVVTLTFLGPSQLVLPETALHATATQASDTMAVATGLIDPNMEGVYFLDFVTGDLQCVVLNERSARLTSVFKTNVLKDLGVDASARKRPKYLMVTGQADFQGIRSSARPALTVVYVVDANTGRFAAYGFTWITSMARAGRPQTGALTLLDVGSARRAVVRE